MTVLWSGEVVFKLYGGTTEVTVWGFLTCNAVLGPVYFNDTINGNVYIETNFYLAN